MKNNNDTNNNDTPENDTFTPYPYSPHPHTNENDLINLTKIHLQRLQEILNSDHPAIGILILNEIATYAELATNLFHLITPNRKFNYIRKILLETLEDIEDCEDPQYKNQLLQYAEKYQEELENLDSEVTYHVLSHVDIQSKLKDFHQAIPEILKKISKYEK
jgi:hypothetical protein